MNQYPFRPYQMIHVGPVPYVPSQLSSFQVIHYPGGAPNPSVVHAIPTNVVVSTPAKKVLSITDPNTRNVLAPVELTNKNMKEDDEFKTKQSISDKFKKQVSNRALSISSSKSTSSTIGVVSNENKPSLEKDITELATADKKWESVPSKTDAINAHQQLQQQKQVKMPFVLPKSNIAHQLNSNKSKVFDDFYPDPSVAYDLCYCYAGNDRFVKDSSSQSDLTEIMDEIKELEEEQPDCRIYSSKFLRLIEKVVSSFPSKDHLCAREQLLLEQPKCVAPRKEMQLNSQSKYIRNKYCGRNSVDSKRQKKPLVIQRSSIERKLIENLPQFSRFSEQPKQNEQNSKQNDSVELVRSTKAWKPKRMENGIETEEEKLEKSKKTVRSILNKITPTNFDSLAKEFFNLHVYEDEKLLPAAVDIIFEKAVEEPKFCGLYANLCCAQTNAELDKKKDKNHNLASKESSQPEEGTSKETSKAKTFHDIILKKCQKSFNANKEFDIVLEELKKEIESAPEDEKSVLIEKMETMKSNEKRRIIGMIRFISHLYRKSLININILSFCVVTLVRLYSVENDESYIEYITQFLKTVGPAYEAQRASFMAKYSATNPWGNNGKKQSDSPIEWYKNIDKVYIFLNSEKEKLSKRYKFMIMNLEDLQANKWKSRELSINEGPKTMDELHKQVEQEEMRNEMEREEYNRKMDRSMNNNSKYSRPNNYSGRPSADLYKCNSTDRLSKAAQASRNTSNQSNTKVGSLSTAMKNDNAKLGPKRGSLFKKNA